MAMGYPQSPFAANIETTKDLLIMVKEFFKPPKCDLCGSRATHDSAEADDVEYTSDDDDINIVENVGSDELSSDAVEAFMKDIAEAEAMCHESSISDWTEVETASADATMDSVPLIVIKAETFL